MGTECVKLAYCCLINSFGKRESTPPSRGLFSWNINSALPTEVFLPQLWLLQGNVELKSMQVLN